MHVESKGENTAYRMKRWILLLEASLLISCHSEYSIVMSGTSLVVQGIRLHTSNAGNPGSIPVGGTRSHVSQLKILCAKRRAHVPRAPTKAPRATRTPDAAKQANKHQTYTEQHLPSRGQRWELDSPQWPRDGFSMDKITGTVGSEVTTLRAASSQRNA